LVLQVFDLLFNKRDYAAAEKHWSPHYIQHSANIAPGREGLFDLIKSLPPTLKYEPGMIVAEGDLVIVHASSIVPGCSRKIKIGDQQIGRAVFDHLCGRIQIASLENGVSLSLQGCDHLGCHAARVSATG
jgi:hypothetical protein